MRHPHTIAILFISFALISAIDARAQADTRESHLAATQSAIAADHWMEAEKEIDQLLLRWPKDEAGLLLKAQIALFKPIPDVSAAKKAISSLPRAVRNSQTVKELDLWIDFKYGSSFMPSVKLMLHQRRAKKLVEDDPNSYLGHFILGAIELSDFRDTHNAVRLPVNADMESVLENLSPATGGATNKNYLSNGNPLSYDIPILRNDAIGEAHGDQALTHLAFASLNGSLRELGLRYLAETSARRGKYAYLDSVATNFIRTNPMQASGYLYKGLALFMKGSVTDAEIYFELGIDKLPEDEKWIYTDPNLVLSTSKKMDEPTDQNAASDYWADQDPYWSTQVNERLTEHRSRVVYADLVWGIVDDGLRGWDTEPGQVQIRYGWPQRSIQFQDEMSRYYQLDYGYRSWIFMDPSKTGQYVFWTPRSDRAAFSGLCDRGRMAIDYAVCAEEWLRDDPERTQIDQSKRLDLKSSMSVFEDANGRTISLPLCFPTADQLPGPSVTIFDRKAGEPIPASGRELTFAERTRHWSEMPCDIGYVVVQQVDMGAHEISVEVDGQRSFATKRIHVDKASSESGFRLSDLLVARLIEESDLSSSPTIDSNSAETGLAFNRMGKTIYPKPELSFDSGAPVYLYFETYGLEEGSASTLQFQAALVPGRLNNDTAPLLGQIFGRKEEATVSVEFSQDVSGPTDSRYVILETKDVKHGSYVLAVRVVVQRTGEQAVISREIVIK